MRDCMSEWVSGWVEESMNVWMGGCLDERVSRGTVS